MKKTALYYSTIALSVTPLFVSAQSFGLSDLLAAIYSLVSLFIPIVFTLALLYFFWGVALFIRTAGESDVKEGKAKMIWGIVGLFVMTSIWGILNIFSLDILGTNISGTEQSSGTTQYATDPVPAQITPGSINSKNEVQYNVQDHQYIPNDTSGLSDSEIDRRLDVLDQEIIGN